MSVMSKTTRGERLLELMQARGALTEAGAAFLQVSLDPFHDTPIVGCTGYPDAETSPSIVRCVKRSINITRPLGFSHPSDTWCFQVNALPWHNGLKMNRRTRRNNVMYGAQSPDVTHGGVEVTCLDIGQPGAAGGADPWFSLATDPQYRCELGLNYSKGLARIIGVGYEITDNTAKLYQQGHCYHSRVASQKLENTTYMYADPNLPSWGGMAATCAHFRNLIPNANTAMLLPDTVDWAASEGCYVVSSFADGNAPTYVDYVMPIYTDSPSSPDWEDDGETGNVLGGANNNGDIYAPTFYWSGAPGVSPPVLPAIRMTNLDASSSMFVGLNKVASFTLTVHYFLESFPGPAEPDILVLATPSAQQDYMALELYAAAVKHLPVAVRVGMNPSGEWWSDVIRAAANTIAPFAGALNPALGIAAKFGGDALADYVDPRKNKGKKSGKGPTKLNAAQMNEVTKRVQQMQSANNNQMYVRSGGPQKLPPQPPRNTAQYRALAATVPARKKKGRGRGRR